MLPVPLEVQVLFVQLAEGRAVGQSWEQMTITLKRPVEELIKFTLLYPDAWKKQLSAARHELAEAGVSQAIKALGETMQSDDVKLKAHAAGTMARIYATQERAKARRQKAQLVKQYEAEQHAERATAKNTEPTTTKQRPDVPPTPKEQNTADRPAKINATPTPLPAQAKTTSTPRRDANGILIL
jgi:hypothetical protein